MTSDESAEVLGSLVCKLQNPLVDSAHDIVLSTCHLPTQIEAAENVSENVEALKVTNYRIKIKWKEETLIPTSHLSVLVLLDLDKLGMTLILQQLSQSSYKPLVIFFLPVQLPPIRQLSL